MRRLLVSLFLIFFVLTCGAFAQSSSTTYTQVVNQAPSGVTVSSSLNPSSYGATVTLTSSVPVGATGTITFSSDGTAIGTSSVAAGSASVSIATLTVGSHAIVASYSGDSNFLGSTSSALTQVVDKATLGPGITLSSNLNPSQFGQLVTFTSTIPNAATGTIQFMDGLNKLGTVTVNNGSALLPISTLAVGTHPITAVYSGDGNFNSGTSTALSQVVQLGSGLGTITQIVANPLSLPAGESDTLLALLSTGGTVPTGSIAFLNNGSSIGNGSFSTASTTNLLPYSNSFVNWTTANNVVAAPAVSAYAVTGPDGSANTATTLALPDTTASGAYSFITLPVPGTAYAGQTLTLSVWLQAATPGTVTLQLTDDPQSNAAQSQSCNVTTAWTRCTLSYSFPANAGTGFIAYIGSTGTTALNVNVWGAQTEQASQAGPYVATAGASATGSGIVSTFTTTALPVGANTLTAQYSGDSNFAVSTSQPVTVTVTNASSGTSLTASPNPSVYGGNVTLTATITGDNPSGTVTFKDGATVLGAGTLSSGTATFSMANLSVGTHSITAVYSGDSNNQSSTSPVVSQVVNKAPVTISVGSSANPSVYGGTVTFTVTEAGPAGTVTPTGTITVMYGGTPLGIITLSSGSGTLTTKALPAGSDQLTFTYGGDANFTKATGTLNQNVTLRATSLSLASSLLPTANVGQTISFTASVTPMGVTGTITLNITSAAFSELLTAPVRGVGQVSWPISNLPAGDYTITAVYSGDSNDAGSKSAPLLDRVANPDTPDFNISINGGNPITPGQNWLGNVMVKGLNGFNGTVQLSCDGNLDPTMDCHLSAQSIDATASGANAGLKVTTTAVMVTVVSSGLMPILLGFFLPHKRRKRAALVALLVGSLVAVSIVIGCGGSGRFVQSNGTPPGTYNLMVTGTSGNLTHTAVVQVTVK